MKAVGLMATTVVGFAVLAVLIGLGVGIAYAVAALVTAGLPVWATILAIFWIAVGVGFAILVGLDTLR